jgi:hypothetical protein
MKVIAAENNKLSSDILEHQFGPTTVEILHQDDMSRSICTKVVSTGQILELSRVTFLQPGLDVFPEVHAAILAGQSMGKAFKTRNIPFYRETHAAFQFELPGGFQHYFKNHGLASVVDVSIYVGLQKVPYAKILETYSPAVSWPGRSGNPTGIRLRDVQLFGDFLRQYAGVQSSVYYNHYGHQK